MTVLSQLLPGSFKGVSFYCVESTMDSGRKQVTHEFPNSDRRYVEDLGRFQNIYKIQALITGNAITYLQNRNALIAALEEPGIGQLVHPFFGNVMVVAKQFTVSEKIGALGEAIFSLTFEKSDNAIVPQGDTTNLSNLNLLADDMLDNLSGDISSIFSTFGNYPNNFLDAQNIIGAIADAFGINTRQFTQVLDSINQFNSLLNQYRDNTNSNILNPTNLGNQTMDLFRQTDELVAQPTDKLTTYRNFYDFYDSQERVPPTTFERIQRQTNRDVLSSAIQTGALTQSYRAAADVNYGNVRELNSVQNQLENQYQKLIDNNNISDATKYKLQDLRNQTRLFFENEKLNVNNITPVQTKRQPLTTLAYSYYGNTDNVESIASLNDVRNNAFVEGALDILTK